MPYIAPEDRPYLDPAIDRLAAAIVEVSNLPHNVDTQAGFSGLLNYSVTRLALQVIKLKFGKIRYWIVALVSGTFHNIADEFYRRLGTPYEDFCICKNGDVDLYAEYQKEIGKEYQTLEKQGDIHEGLPSIMVR